MGSNEANNWPQTVEKDVEFALKLHNAKNRGKGRGESPKLLPQRLYFSNLLVLTGFRNEFHEKFGLLCFSKSWANPLMWSQYGDRHRRICLGFDVSDDRVGGLYFESFDENLVLREVILGPQCEHSVESARELVGRNSDVEVVKARIAFQTFKVVLDRRSTEGRLADH